MLSLLYAFRPRNPETGLPEMRAFGPFRSAELAPQTQAVALAHPTEEGWQEPFAEPFDIISTNIKVKDDLGHEWLVIWSDLEDMAVTLQIVQPTVKVDLQSFWEEFELA